MTEKENKAIKYLKNEIERINKENNFKKIPRDIVCLPLFIDYAETLFNLIENLQKENEELKNKVIKRDNDIIYLEETAEKEFITKQEVKENYISKDKIREKLKQKQERAKKYYEKRGVFHNCNLCNNTCSWYKFCITYEELLEEE